MARPLDILEYMLEQRPIKHMGVYRGHRLLYLSYAWGWVWDGKKLFKDPIRAWASGPIIDSVYKRFPRPETVLRPGRGVGESNKLTDGEKATVDSVLASYDPMLGPQLEEFALDYPWKRTRKGMEPTERGNRIIKDSYIIEAYTRIYRKMYPATDGVDG